MIAPRLNALRAEHPGILLRLIGEKREASLSRREADLAVRLKRPDEKRLVARKLGTFAVELYASPAYLAERRPEDFVFIAYDEESDDLPQQKWLMSFAGERPIVFKTNDLEAQRAAARNGVGIAALPNFLGDGDAGLKRLDLAIKPVVREVWLIVHGDLRRTPPVSAVMDFLSGCLQPIPIR